MLSPTSVHLTWVAPCNTQQYHIYYRGTCGAYVNGSSLETDRVYVDESSLNTSQYTVDGIQEGINYSFTVNQTGFRGSRVFSTGPVYARTFTAGRIIYELTYIIIIAKSALFVYTQFPLELPSHCRACLCNQLKCT